MNFQKKNKSLQFSYYSSTNPINFTIAYDQEADTAILSQVNLERENGFYIELMLPYTKGIWTTNNTISTTFNKISDSTAILGVARPFLYAYTNHQFKIKNNMTLELGAWGIDQTTRGVLFERNGLIVFNASVSKTIHDKWSFALRLNDIGRAMNFKEGYNINGVNAVGEFFADAREIAVSVKYQLGNGFKRKSLETKM